MLERLSAVSDMQLRLSDVPSEGLTLDDQCDPALIGPLDEARLVEPISLHLVITPQGDRYAVEGTVTAHVEVDCSRCLAPTRFTVRAPYRIEALPLAGQSGAEGGRGLERGELDVIFYAGDVLDLADLVREQIVLNVPMRALCREECLGLCPDCRANRNEGPCGCPEPSSADPRFEVLRRISRGAQKPKR